MINRFSRQIGNGVIENELFDSEAAIYCTKIQNVSNLTVMHTNTLLPLSHRHRPEGWRETCARLIAPLTLWICVSVTLRYGYFGNCSMVLGPSSSRLLSANSVFVKQVEVREADNKAVFLHGFSEKPELSLQTNWTVSVYVILNPYSRKGFYLWLNKGSRIQMRWEAQTSSLNELQVSLIQGERKYETILPISTNSPVSNHLKEPIEEREATYVIKEDDRYYIGITNTKPRSIIMVMNVTVSSTMYDVTKAKSTCSTMDGSCQIAVVFPNTRFIVVATPNNGDLGGWNIELSIVARAVIYVAILVSFMVIILLILKFLGACDHGGSSREVEPRSPEVRESRPLLPEKQFQLPYGTGEEGGDSGNLSSSEDLYDGKICIICYDLPRNCFFVPCGHCTTCHDCAQRIMDAEKKVCPICRRLIHKTRKLLIP